MIAKSVTLLMTDLGVLPSHSRPHVSNDNPFSEAQFKTMKYQPDYPSALAAWSMRAPGRKLLPLIQRGAPPQRHRLHDARGRALR